MVASILPLKYRYRDYKVEPLSKTEIRSVLKRLGVGPREVLRKKDRAYKEAGLTSARSAEALLDLF